MVTIYPRRLSTAFKTIPISLCSASISLSALSYFSEREKEPPSSLFELSFFFAEPFRFLGGMVCSLDDGRVAAGSLTHWQSYYKKQTPKKQSTFRFQGLSHYSCFLLGDPCTRKESGHRRELYSKTSDATTADKHLYRNARAARSKRFGLLVWSIGSCHVLWPFSAIHRGKNQESYSTPFYLHCHAWIPRSGNE